MACYPVATSAFIMEPNTACHSAPLFAVRLLCYGIDCAPGAERLYGPDAGYVCHCARALAEGTPVCKVLKRFGGRPGAYILDGSEALWAFIIAPGLDSRLYVDAHRAERNRELLLKYVEGLAKEADLRVVYVNFKPRNDAKLKK